MSEPTVKELQKRLNDAAVQFTQLEVRFNDLKFRQDELEKRFADVQEERIGLLLQMMKSGWWTNKIGDALNELAGKKTT